MRKPNVEIKRVNLAKAELQLGAYQNQLFQLENKVEEVRSKYNAKLDQITLLRNEIKSLESQTNTAE